VLRDILTKTLWDQRRLLVGWAVGLALVTAVYSSIYPSIRESGAAAVENYPEALKDAFNLQDVASPAGYLGSAVFGILLPVLIVLFAVVAGARAIAGDEEAGTLDLLLAHPVSRPRLLLQRFGALVVAIALLGLAVLLALLAVSGPGELDLGVGRLVAAVAQLALLGLAFGSLALAVGAATGRRALVVGICAVVAVVAYLGNTLARQVDGLGWLRRVSPFWYYSGGDPLRNGFQLGDSAVLLVASLLLVGAGLLLFTRRDVAV
jgi:ABC-2 type transport system permease protein